MTEPTSSSTGQDAVAALAPPDDRILRPARALLGWIPQERALLLLNSNRADVQPTEEQRQQVAAAATAVRDRAIDPDQVGLVQELGEVLTDHVAALRSGAAASYFAEGWRVALVDLRRVCAFQPTVFSDSASERSSGVDVEDLGQLARVTLPTQWNLEQQAQFDETRHQWMLVSRNPNLRVIGHFGGVLQDGQPPAFGFFVTIQPSFLQVAEYRGRYFLRDGYHRATGLLAIGATRVPAFVRSFTSVQQMVPQGMLPHEAFLGDRPPRIADYADDAVAATVQLPASQKMIVVQALELAPQG